MELVNILQTKYAIILAAGVLAVLFGVVLSAWLANFWQQAHATLAQKLADEARENGVLRERVEQLEEGAHDED